MSNSLVIANSIEVLSGGVISQLPLAAGAVYRLSPGWDLSAPQPVIDVVGSMMIDGSRPFGRRAENRVITLPITIVAPDLTTLAGAREALLQLIDQNIWTLTWVRDGGPGPVVFDCFRAQPSVVAYSLPLASVKISQVEISFEAMPYPRSTTQQQIAFPLPLPGSPPAPPAPLVLDQFSTISSGPLWSQSRACVVGPTSGCWDPSPSGFPDGRDQVLVYSNPFAVTQNITGLTGLSFWLGLGSRNWWNHEYQGRTKVTVAFALTDTSGNKLSFWVNKRLHVANSVTSPSWSFISTAIPQGNTVFNYASVGSMTITITNRAQKPETRYLVVFLDNVTAFPPARVAAAPSPKGNVHTLSGVQGTVHAPVSLQAQGAATPGTPTTVTTAGISAYTVPANTVYLKVEAWGAGGAGAGETGAGFGGGGGGSEYAREDVFLATAGQVIPYSVGAGGTQGAVPVDGQATVFGPGPGGLTVVAANGGKSALQNSITGAAGGTGSTNAIHFPGGAGRTASGSVGGGGGSSGGTSSAGATPVGSAAVVFTAAGSNPWTCPNGVTQVYAECWGSGASAATGAASTNGGGGGGGEYAAAFINVTPGNVYAAVVAAGGAAVSGTGASGNNGASSTFTGDSGGVVTAHGGTKGVPSGSFGAGAGGTGSANTVHFNGGQGGTASPYSGGGGSSAGSVIAGNAGNGYGTAGAAPADGGAGGAGSGANASINGQAGHAPGGGGGGTYGATTSGAGAAGQVRITYPGGAPTNNGAAAPSGGGAGGAGGPSANTVGSAGSAPGGGGGGADSTGTAEAGGAGAAGKLVITPYQLTAFKTLIAHRPSPEAPVSFMPLVSVGNGADTPNGGTEYTVPPMLPAPALNLNAQFVADVSNWTAVNNASLSWSTVWLPAGSALFSGNGATANPNMISEKTVAVVPATKYTGSALLFSPQGFATCQVIITWYDSTGTLISTSASGSVNVPAGVSAGTLVSVVNATAPATAASASLTVQMTGTPANTVLMYADVAQIVNPLSTVNAKFNGTYTVVLAAVSPMNTPANSRTITVTVKQYEVAGGASSSSSVAVALVPNGSGAQPAIKNGIVVVGEITLPQKEIPSDNTTALFTVTVTDTNTSDRFYDCLFLDTAGQTLILNEPTTGYVTYYADEPDPHNLLGRHMGSNSGRGSAVSVLDACDAISGGALTVEPGDNMLLTYSVEGAPSIGVNYFPRFFIDRPY